MRRFCLALVLFCAAQAASAAPPFDHQHRAWTALLAEHVVPIRSGLSSETDYSGFALDRDALGAYLGSLSAVTEADYQAFSREQRLAFLINSYNAFTVELILTRYPKLDSIRELGSWLTSAWEKRFVPLLGEMRSLDDIEHGMIRARGAFDDPRIHFAVNCASIGCPALASEAFVAERLEAQLALAAQRFLADPSRNRYDPDRGELQVSELFDWYGGDFNQGDRGIVSLTAFFGAHAGALSPDPQHQARIQAGDYRLKFLPYDWALNDCQSRGPDG